MSLQIETTTNFQTAARLGGNGQMSAPTNRPNLPAAEPTHSLMMLANRFCADALGSVVTGSHCLNLEFATADFEEAIEQFKKRRPTIVLLDPHLHPSCINRLEPLVREQFIENLVILDDRLREGLLARVLQLPRTSYFTRKTSLKDLRQAIESIAKTSVRLFDAEVEARIVKSPQGYTLKPRSDQPSLSSLTGREMEVLVHITSGMAVRECAAQLNVAISTIDNHKSRIMRKLEVHKTSQLIHLAIREGIVQV